jgi:hypothetical protein
MTQDRISIDPDDLYPASGFRQVERNALKVLDLMPLGRLTRTRDVIQIDDGGERGLSVLVTAEAIEFRLPMVEWTAGAYGPASCTRLWKRYQFAALSDKRLASLIRAATEARRNEFISCRYCQRLIPTEHRNGDVCHGCAERHEGIVH